MRCLNRLPLWTLVTSWLIVGTAFPALYGWVRGVRNPNDVLVHDEQSYLLQADTFARGRLTNRAPRHAEFFESPYLLMDPSDQAKYPPAQAILLAVGRRFLGHPIGGVWLSCGLFAGALYWMLSGWANRRWAMLGTLYAVAVVGVTSYWATTYWGGMVAACGGALVLGGTRWTVSRRTVRQWTTNRGLLTGLGAVILANSRPYEGSVVCLACAPVLACWMLGGSRRERLAKVTGWCGPFVLVVAAGAVGMAVYNQAVTGNWKIFPFALHTKQYLTCGMFRWQPINQIPERRLTTRVGLFYEKDGLLNPGTPDGPQTGASGVEHSVRRAFLDLFQNFVSPVNLVPNSELRDSPTVRLSLLAIFLAMTVWFLCATKRWGVLHAAWSVLILEVLAGGAVWWNLPHYQAPIVCLCYFLVIDGIRRALLACRRTRLLRRVPVQRLILVFILLIPTVVLGSRLERVFPSRGRSPVKDAASASPLVASSPALTRPQLLEFLARQRRPALALVSYDSAVPLYEEWVYNSADLESERVVLAHDLGPKKLSLLTADFPNRDVWQVHVTPQGATAQRNL